MVRVRFAPSPTGYLHLGNARTALFNWLFARHTQGKLILRIEDTDIERSGQDYVEKIIEDLRWLGLDWDEGIDVGGEFAPYQQSKRLDIYKGYASNLISKGLAYYCYCTNGQLEQRRQEAIKAKQPPRYDNRCRNLTETQKKAFEAQGIKPALRFKVPEQTIVVNDLIRGAVTFDTKLMGDFVIMKKEETPSFNFAVCIDDMLMKITHVIRGEDHLSNTPKHLMIFRALDVTLPQFAHLPMILGEDRTRMSKRDMAISVAQYRQMGYLPQALVNYLALLGWSSTSQEEILSTKELINQFELERVNKSAASFNLEKLNWINASYIHKTSTQEITRLVLDYLKNKNLISQKEIGDNYSWWESLITIIKEHLVTIAQIEKELPLFKSEKLEINEDARNILRQAKSREILQSFVQAVNQMPLLDGQNFKQAVKAVGDKAKVKGKELYLPLRLALTGKEEGLELAQLVPFLGKEMCLKRIKLALEV